MKQVYSYQEIDTLIEQGMPVAFTRQLEAHVTAVQPRRDRNTITVIIQLCLGDYFLGEVECEFATIAGLLEAFDICERVHLWEVAEEGQAGTRGRW